MDDIDREIKRVQLQREQLALERDQALHGAAGAAQKTAKAFTRGTTGTIKTMGQGFRRAWKGLAIVAVLTLSLAGGLAWVKEQERQEQAELHSRQIEAWGTVRKAFLSKECPEATYVCSTADEWAQKDPAIAQYVCGKKASARALCELSASMEYDRRVPMPLNSFK